MIGAPSNEGATVQPHIIQPIGEDNGTNAKTRQSPVTRSAPRFRPHFGDPHKHWSQRHGHQKSQAECR